MAIKTAINDNSLIDTLGSKLDLAGGKILQIVRATDTTERTTSSTSFVDASISVTITPQKNDSALILIWKANAFAAANARADFRITDASDNPISGAENERIGAAATNPSLNYPLILIGYASPSTTNAITYKGRFLTTTATSGIANSTVTGQLYAIEVSA